LVLESTDGYLGRVKVLHILFIWDLFILDHGNEANIYTIFEPLLNSEPKYSIADDFPEGILTLIML
jgi:hypothetical protein